MKRSGFRNRIHKPMKRTPLRKVSLNKVIKPKKRKALKKQSTQKISILKRKLWELFSKFIRQRDKGICFTCGRQCEGKGYHAGHFVPKSVGGLALYFHEENVHGQCYHCNINLGGNSYIYGEKLGNEKAQELYKLKHTIVKWGEKDYLEKIEYYHKKLEI